MTAEEERECARELMSVQRLYYISRGLTDVSTLFPKNIPGFRYSRILPRGHVTVSVMGLSVWLY